MKWPPQSFLWEAFYLTLNEKSNRDNYKKCTID
jgi:hypothetical protein